MSPQRALLGMRGDLNRGGTSSLAVCGQSQTGGEDLGGSGRGAAVIAWVGDIHRQGRMGIRGLEVGEFERETERRLEQGAWNSLKRDSWTGKSLEPWSWW